MNKLDDQIDTIEAKILELDYILEFMAIDDAALLERRDALLEERGSLLEALTLRELFDTSKDYG
jgi:hypothetical protein